MKVNLFVLQWLQSQLYDQFGRHMLHYTERYLCCVASPINKNGEAESGNTSQSSPEFVAGHKKALHSKVLCQSQNCFTNRGKLQCPDVQR